MERRSRDKGLRDGGLMEKEESREAIRHVVMSLDAWMGESEKLVNTAQISALLIETGSELAFSCAPNIEEAKEHIQKAVRIALDICNKRKLKK